ncbi:Mitochondrial-processing peptidase subunit alpha [Erysiphe neolycopersici]|uniref:Mitochondrial-processing peptidase subunit alpha n=1 Tax=Erysiphe neolycopersici TaxID=212602 RepID=A0A420I048_9PEZI|nr:Mitochondrial-processing peptidase subunit alpha [Erysiphe neolycopersici]
MRTYTFSKAVIRVSPLTYPSFVVPAFRSRSLSTKCITRKNPPPTVDPSKLDEISTLSNGVRVATEALPGHFSGIGVFIDAGSRFENEELRGISHIIDRLAFKSTQRRNSDEMLQALESLGGNINCASSRESLMYQCATFNSAVSDAVAILAETIRDPLITENEVQEQLETAAYEIGEIWSKPELILPELVHTAAYKGNTLGNPLLCPKERLTCINKGVIEAYRNTFFRPERIVLAFAGVKHHEALKLVENYFGDIPALHKNQLNTGLENLDNTSVSGQLNPTHVSSPPSAFNNLSSQTNPPVPSILAQTSSKITPRSTFYNYLSTWAADNSTEAHNLPFSLDFSQPSHYTGGFLSLPNLPPPTNPSFPALTHIHLAFESLAVSSEDIYALATIQTLLGGGGSFSAGGPGKGMYSRLYTNVLNQYGWVESCVAFNHSYTDSGLFGISASCVPAYVPQMLDTMCRELHALTLENGPYCLQAIEVKRAKNQLRSSLLMNLESRMVELEDLGRQVQVHGKKISPIEMCHKIDRLTINDLRRVAKTVFGGMVKNPGCGSGAPTVVLQECADRETTRKEFKWETIQDLIASWNLGRT